MASQSTVSFKVHSVGAVRRSSFGRMTAWVLFFVALFNLFNGVAVADVEVDKRGLGKKAASKSAEPVDGVKINIRDFDDLSDIRGSDASNMPLAERNLKLILCSIRRHRPAADFLMECKNIFSCIFNKDSITVPQVVYDQLIKLGENFTGYFRGETRRLPKIVMNLAEVFTREIYGPKPTAWSEKRQWDSKRGTVLTLLWASAK
ncbi:uncharacterized protein BBOV_IV007130 [Babesia bovis T2Bo]|uniref:Membrane protein, putative n=1 Tax=Babesia bovis TaxID=5865 RepID=A7ARA0_BABBO|nr:uncharacterized protein BBOV_IV007130 [Babesia bovis T2Bo]EDO07069.1 putative integral membrane protein [Babesia bovis T2Bo]|eukprot:XP_001610637.1 hypothetical protein [Babesia bovis T2Bo]